MTAKSTIFLDVTLYSLVEMYGIFRGTYCFHLQDRIVPTVSSRAPNPTRSRTCFPPSVYYSILKTEALRSSETSVNVYRIARHHNKEDSTLHSHHYGDLSLNILVTYLWSILYDCECRISATRPWNLPERYKTETGPARALRGHRAIFRGLGLLRSAYGPVTKHDIRPHMCLLLFILF
jgi:hypothetical protein